MRRGLVGDRIRLDAALHQFRIDLGGIAEQRDRDRLLLLAGAFEDGQRLVEILRLHVDIAGAQPHLDARRLAFDREHRGARHGRGQRLRAAHAAETGGQNPAALEIAAEMLAAHLDEGLVGALHDALRADIDPGAGRHLAVHHQALAIELVEIIERRPMRHDVGIGDQHARRIGVGPENADRLAGLHQQRLVVLQRLQRRHDAVIALPVARGSADAAIDHELVRLLGDVRIEIVHQHAQRRFGLPALAGHHGAAGRADDAVVVEAF